MKSVRKMFGSLMGKDNKRDADDADVDCPICFEPLGNEPTIETPCKHKFHRRCLRTWCNTNFQSRCPVCRKTITATCNTLNQEPQIQAPLSIQPAPIIPAPQAPQIQAPQIQAPQIQAPQIQPDWRDNIDYNNMDWNSYYDQSMRENHEWEPIFYDRWLTTGQPNTAHVRSLDVSELGDMLPFSDGHTIQLDIQGICNGFPNLRVLKLNGNNLTSIPACIGTLRNLEFLDLANNNIPAHEVEAIFANPYWNDKSVSIKADNVTFDNNNLPYGFFISNNGSLRSNNRSTRSRVAPPQNAGKKRRTRKYRRTKRRRSKRRK